MSEDRVTKQIYEDNVCGTKGKGRPRKTWMKAMAKSLRSKWRRKCRAVKRVRYGQKELERLKKTLGLDKPGTDVDITEISEVAIVKEAEDLKEKPQTEETEGNDMETDKPKRVFSRKTMRDQNGTYPIWMHPRKIHRNKKAVKKRKEKAKKQKQQKKK